MPSLGDMLEDMRQNEAAGKKLPELAKKYPKSPTDIGNTGNVVLPPRAPKYSIPYSDPSNWEVGVNQPGICQLSERTKRIMRGEDPNGN